MECPEKIRSYMEALTEEQRKIQVFQRELPLCMELVNQALEACKQQLSGSTTTSTEEMNGQISECSEMNSIKASPVLEEFIPMKTSTYKDQMDRDEAEHVNDERHSGNYGSLDNDKKKSNWLKSAQLWNHNPEATHDKDPPSPKRASVDGNSTNTSVSIHDGEKPAAGNSRLNSGRAVSPLLSPDAAAASTSSSAENGCNGVSKREETIKQKPSVQRKQRRCWSSDLHRRFLNALQQLGGPHVATPKQIRELMKVDDLTNDEVKSHLQKYRLHAKNSPSQNSGGAIDQQPQFVVVGGIWMPQPQYTTVALSLGEACGIFAPVATPLPSKSDAQAPQKPSRSNSDEDRYGSSNSATISSSAHTVSVC